MLANFYGYNEFGCNEFTDTETLFCCPVEVKKAKFTSFTTTVFHSFKTFFK